ncbi:MULTISPECIES: hypothetical protein [unclassified Arthrobacter]|jgi:hypothetical protein|uniref:hypothetical protein n=1 Tax=Arthrobacter sp. Leaf234 TaxID=1736303 RepID=UPI0006FFDBE3|nr:hypothetical protein [Arthrobacter sp. Leaf234]KQO00983.1 hypothetical protein ASF21_11945 [Arthrobacter sp. Leaf234]
MNETDMPTAPDADQARRLLAQADQIGGSVRTGAGWPQISLLLGLGAISSLGVIALAYAAQIPGASIVLPMGAMLVWLAIFVTMALVFAQTAKRGFGARWGLYIGGWSVLWVAGIILAGSVFVGDLGFAAAHAAALTLLTAGCALYEARR